MKKLAVIGSPVAHSKSPLIQNSFAAALNLTYSYSTVEVTRDALPEFIERARGGEFAGFNVTMPLKEAIVPYLDTTDGTAVNTVVHCGGKLYGSSTDGIGTVLSLLPHGGAVDETFGSELRGQNVLILGMGGAAKAASSALCEVGACVTVLSRRETLPPLGDTVTRPWNELQPLAAQADIIINATPLGMHGNAEFENFAWLDGAKNNAVVFDFVYNPIDTALLRAAAERRLVTIGGLRLLVLQAAASFESFTGIAVPSDVVTKVMSALH